MGGDEGWRVVRARVYLVMGLTTACLALYVAISLDPAPPFLRQQFQMIKDSRKQQLEQGHPDWAGMTVEQMEMLAAVQMLLASLLLLLLLAMAQALMTIAADVARSRVGTFLALLMVVPLAWRLFVVLTDVLTYRAG